jgi:hypothetical protein
VERVGEVVDGLREGMIVGVDGAIVGIEVGTAVRVGRTVGVLGNKVGANVG